MLLSGLFLLQLMLGGGSAAVGVEMGMGTDTADTAVQAAMSMAAADEDVSAGPLANPSEEAPCSEDLPCHAPGAPNACRTTGPCRTAVSATATKLGLTIPFTQSGHAVAVEIRAPHNRLSPPETPPPRS